MEAFFSVNASHFVYEVFLIITITLLTVFLFKFIIERALTRMQNSKKFWLKSILKSINTPIVTLILLIGGIYLIDAFDNNLALNLLNDFSILKKLSVILTASWFAFNLIETVEDNYLLKRRKNSKIDQGTADALTKTARITVIVLVSLLSMQTLGFSVSALVAFGGGGGVVAGFAAKDMLSNFFGALSIYLDKPFVVGDWIRSPDKEIEGVVQRIGLRITKIRTLDRRPLYVQNAIFNTLSIENISKMSHRRIKEKFVLSYKNLKNLDKVTAAIEKMLRNHPDIEDSMTVAINLVSFNTTSATLILMAFTKKNDFEEFCKLKQDVLLKLSTTVSKEGCELTELHPTAKIAAEMK